MYRVTVLEHNAFSSSDCNMVTTMTHLMMM